MEAVAVVFAVLMIAATIAATILVSVLSGSLWAGAGFAALMALAYRAATRDRASPRMQGDTLNAFQQPLSDD